MKIRVFKKEDNSVVYDYPSVVYQDKMDECPIPEIYKDLPFIVCDSSEVPESNSKADNYHEKIYFDGDCTLKNLKQDKNWKKVLMPTFLIKSKYIDRTQKEIDIELEQQEPDLQKLLKYQRSLDKIKSYSDLEIYKIALEQLDRKVDLDKESDKPEIRKKLNSLIKNLSK